MSDLRTMTVLSFPADTCAKLGDTSQSLEMWLTVGCPEDTLAAGGEAYSALTLVLLAPCSAC